MCAQVHGSAQVKAVRGMPTDDSANAACTAEWASRPINRVRPVQSRMLSGMWSYLIVGLESCFPHYIWLPSHRCIHRRQSGQLTLAELTGQWLFHSDIREHWLGNNTLHGDEKGFKDGMGGNCPTHFTRTSNHDD